jgi:hypothetical protein
MDLLRRLLNYREEAILHLDSTGSHLAYISHFQQHVISFMTEIGSIVTKLPDYISLKRLYYYVVWINLPEDQKTPMIPILEFISNSHSANQIGRTMEAFFEGIDLFEYYIKSSVL